MKESRNRNHEQTKSRARLSHFFPRSNVPNHAVLATSEKCNFRDGIFPPHCAKRRGFSDVAAANIAALQPDHFCT